MVSNNKTTYPFFGNFSYSETHLKEIHHKNQKVLSKEHQTIE